MVNFNSPSGRGIFVEQWAKLNRHGPSAEIKGLSPIDVYLRKISFASTMTSTRKVNISYDRKLQRAEEILTIEITKKTEIFSTIEIKTSEKVYFFT